MKSGLKDSSHDFDFCLYEKQSEAIDVELKLQAYGGAMCLQSRQQHMKQRVPMHRTETFPFRTKQEKAKLG